MEDIKTALKAVLARLDAPSTRKELRDDSDIHWLGRNLAVNNPEGADLDEARAHLEALGARMVL